MGVARAGVQVDLPSSMRSLQPLETAEGTDLRVGVSGRVNIAVDLRMPLRVTPTRRREMTVTRISFWADEPRAVAKLLHERVTAHADT